MILSIDDANACFIDANYRTDGYSTANDFIYIRRLRRKSLYLPDSEPELIFGLNLSLYISRIRSNGLY
jgi:hypothetical protein